MDKNTPELWHQLSNETPRSYQAFKVFMFMSPAERSVVGAWREWTGNPEADRPSPFFEEWARNYGWQERARAHDHHIELLRESGMEEAVKEEAKKQARAIETLHYRYHELMAIGYERAMQYLEDDDFVKHMRPADVVALIKLHFEGVQKLGDPSAQEVNSVADWTEDEQREFDRVVGEIDAEEEKRASEAAEAEEAQEEPSSGSEDGDEGSKDAEGEQD